jgi:hypothetical protein
MSVRRWAIPLTCLGLGGLGAILLSERGRKTIRSAAERFSATFSANPGQLADWNDSAQEELNHIEQAIKELEQSLGTQTAH